MMALGMEVGLSAGDCVRWGPGPLGPSQIFGPFLLWPNGWIHQDATYWYGGMPQSMGLCVRLGPAPSPKRGRAPFPIFGPCLLWPNCWMDQDGTWHGGGHWSRPHCARLEPSSRPQNGGQRLLPNFRPTSIVAKRLHGSRCTCTE